jgi:RNA polymerase sigma-70 factor (ECF subfamily)
MAEEPNCGPPTDGQVAGDDLRDIRECLSGEEDAYARLVRRHQAQVAAQMWRFTRDRSTLEELVQDVFVEAYRSLRTYKGRAPFLHWLRRIATRVGYRFWKHQARDRKRREALAAWHASQPPPEDPTPPAAAEYLHLLLEQLPPADRLVLTLLYFEECSTREIAERTGWSRAWVKVRALRARRKLKPLLEKAGFGRRRYA